MSNSDSHSSIIGDNPFYCLTRGVEADVLCILGRSHIPYSGSHISTITGRSRSQIQNVLVYLARNGIVESRKHKGIWHNTLNTEHPLEPLLRQIAELRLSSDVTSVTPRRKVNALPSAVHALDAIDE
jgi:DNA-binding transcriptional regulator GbsR (MarR family)